jgi:hypothetical protein
MEGGEMHTGCRWGEIKKKDNLEDLGIYWKIILKSIFKMWDGETWTGFTWLRIETGDWHLEMTELIP